MRDFFRALAIIILAAITSAGLVAALIFLTQRLTVQSLTPAHFIPSSRVIAYVDHPTDELMSYATTWIPSLSTTINENAEAVVVTSFDEDVASIQFARNTSSATGPFTTLASTSGALLGIGESTDALHTHNDYVALRSVVPTQTPWMFVRLSKINDPLLNTFQDQGYSALGLWVTDTEAHLHLVGPVQPSLQGISPLLSVPEGGILSIRATNGLSAWTHIVQNLDASHGVITNQLLQKRTSTLFGPSIDFQFHVLPLLEQSGALHLKKHSSGSILFALEGRASKKAIDRLHDGFAEALPKTRVVQRIFDERFPSTDVRIDPSVITDETTINSGWTTRTTGHRTESQKFFSARNGQMFVISNDEQLLNDLIINDKPSVQLPVGPSLKRSSIVAGGMMDIHEGLRIMHTYVPSLEIPTFSPLIAHLSGSVIWSMEQKSGLTSLILRQQ